MTKKITINGFGGVAPTCKINWTRSAQAFKNEVNRSYTELSKNELSDLVRKAQSEKNAKKKSLLEEKILNALGPLIMRLAMQYATSDNYMDYVQDACLTVIKQCVDGFNTRHESNSSFVTYCKRAIVANFNVTADSYCTVATGLKRSEISLIRNYIANYERLCDVEPSEEEIKKVCEDNDITYTKDIVSGIVIRSVDDYNPESDDTFYGPSVVADVDRLTIDKNLEPDSWVNDFDSLSLLSEIRDLFIKVQTEQINKKTNEPNTRYKNNLRDIDILFKYYGAAGFQKKTRFELALEYGLTEEMIRVIIERTPKMIMAIVRKSKLNEIEHEF